MKAVYTVNEKLVFELEGSNQREVFEELSTIDEIFSARECGKCHSKNIKYQVRENGGNKFYELKCKDCGATFAFGCHKQTKTLYPKLKSEDGTWLPDSGWSKWIPPAK